MKSPHASSSLATTALINWLNSLNEDDLLPYSGSAEVDAMAFWNLQSIMRLLADPSVDLAIEHTCGRWPGPAGTARCVEIIKTMLVDACWISRSLNLSDQPSANAGVSVRPGTRTEHSRELMAAAKKAAQLARTVSALKPVIGRGLTCSYLVMRARKGDPAGFIANRKGWSSAILAEEIGASELLKVLSADLKEEAGLLMNAAAKSRQQGGSKRRYYPLIDSLFATSTALGVSDPEGKPCPDFPLVYAILASIAADDAPDERMLRQRWIRKGKLKLKSP